MAGGRAVVLGMRVTALPPFDPARLRSDRTRLEWAQLLHQRNGPGDVEHAAQLLSQALATALDLGLGGVERRARALLEECR